MGHPYWPLFDLVIRTPRIELRPPTDDDVVAIVALSDEGIHDPATMPFAVPWTDWEPPFRHRQTMQWWWKMGRCIPRSTGWKPNACCAASGA